MVLHPIPYQNWPALWKRPEEIAAYLESPHTLPNNIAFVLWRGTWHATKVSIWDGPDGKPFFCSPFSTCEDSVCTYDVAPFAMRTLPVPVTDLIEMQKWMQHNAPSVKAWATAQGQKSPISLKSQNS